jgi:hypothetical protein
MSDASRPGSSGLNVREVGDRAWMRFVQQLAGETDSDGWEEWIDTYHPDRPLSTILIADQPAEQVVKVF